MFEAWGRFVYRHRWPVLAISIVLLVASGFIAGQGGKLESGGFIETAESGRASRLIEQELPIVGGFSATLPASALRDLARSEAIGVVWGDDRIGAAGARPPDRASAAGARRG